MDPFSAGLKNSSGNGSFLVDTLCVLLIELLNRSTIVFENDPLFLSIFFRETPPPPLQVNLMANCPYYPNYRLYFRETPSPPLQVNLMGTTLTTPTTVCFLERPHPTLSDESDGNNPYYPNYRLYFRETPPPPLELNLMATTLTTPTTFCFLERPHPHSWSWIWMATTLTTPTTGYFWERLHPHPWSWIWMATTLTTPTTVWFLETPPPLFVYSMHMVYIMGIDFH